MTTTPQTVQGALGARRVLQVRGACQEREVEQARMAALPGLEVPGAARAVLRVLEAWQEPVVRQARAPASAEATPGRTPATHRTPRRRVLIGDRAREEVDRSVDEYVVSFRERTVQAVRTLASTWWKSPGNPRLGN